MSNILNGTRTAALCVKINAAAKKEVARDINSCLSNLEYLMKDKTVDGETRKYLPLSVKEEVFHLIYPEGYVHCEVDYSPVEKIAHASAYVYADDEGKNCIGEGLADQSFNEVPIFDSESRVLQGIRRIAKGRAKSDALRDAGIASWLGDTETLEEMADKADEDKNNDLTAIKREDNNSSTPAETSTPTQPLVQKSSDKPTAEMLSMPIHGGKYDGKTIGELKQKDPAYLAKLYTAYKAGAWKNAGAELISAITTVLFFDKDTVEKFQLVR